MAKEIVLARVRARAEYDCLALCPGARAGDLVAQAMAPNGDSVLGIFYPVIPGSDRIAQCKGWAEGEALLVLHRFVPNE